MSESTLSAAYEEIRIEVADFLGLGRTAADWDADSISRLTSIMKAGLHQFYFPPKFEEGKDPHRWSFLTPVASLATVEEYSTGTVGVSGSVCTLTGGTWPTWAYTNGILFIDGTLYPVTSREDGTYLYVTGDEIAAGATYELIHNGAYVLPDNFASMACRYLTQSREEFAPRIKLIGEGQIRTMQQGNYTVGKPVYAAVRPKTTTGSTGQRWEILFYPIPDAIYTLYYRYRLLPEMLAAGLYTYGGGVHTQTIIQSCIAAAELKMDGVRGVQWDHFQSLLTASIENDIELNRTMDFGYNGDNDSGIIKRHESDSYVVTINDTDPDNF